MAACAVSFNEMLSLSGMLPSPETRVDVAGDWAPTGAGSGAHAATARTRKATIGVLNAMPSRLRE